MTPARAAFIIMLAVGAAGAATAPAPAAGQNSDRASPDDQAPDLSRFVRADHPANDMRARLYRELSDTRITVNFVGTPVGDAIDEIAAKLSAPVVVRSSDDPIGHGLERHVPVTALYRDLSALAVLEDILLQASHPKDPCTWQIRRGFIEIGTKSRLSAPAACERRTYYIRDFMMNEAQDMTPGAIRIPPDAVALDLVEVIVTTIEPEMWDWGQIDYETTSPPAPELFEPASGAPVGGGEPVERRAPAQANPAAEPSNAPYPRYIPREKPAIIRHWRDVIIVDAPDFVHRRINGYPARGTQPADEDA